MKLYAFLFSLFAGAAFAQNIDSFKSADTVFLYLKEKDKTLYKNLRYKFGKNQFGKTYDITDNEEKSINIFAPNDSNTRIKSNLLYIGRKEFLEKKKDQVLSLDVINEIGLKEIFFDVLNVQEKRRKIYVITDEDLKNRNLVLKKARLGYSDFVRIDY